MEPRYLMEMEDFAENREDSFNSFEPHILEFDMRL